MAIRFCFSNPEQTSPLLNWVLWSKEDIFASQIKVRRDTFVCFIGSLVIHGSQHDIDSKLMYSWIMFPGSRSCLLVTNKNWMNFTTTIITSRCCCRPQATMALVQSHLSMLPSLLTSWCGELATVQTTAHHRAVWDLGDIAGDQSQGAGFSRKTESKPWPPVVQMLLSAQLARKLPRWFELDASVPLASRPPLFWNVAMHYSTAGTCPPRGGCTSMAGEVIPVYMRTCREFWKP